MSLVPVVSPLVITCFRWTMHLQRRRHWKIKDCPEPVGMCLQTRSGRQGIFSESIFLFRKNAAFTSEPLFHSFNALNVRIGPIVRRVRNPSIGNVHIYPCDFAGYQNELLCTYSQTDSEYRWLRGCLGRVQRRLFFRCRVYAVRN